ncbi:MAG: DUF3794 domain-containing protein [Clostridia bacterium]|nr:DUF3794 domain-containing protein [Clostridia bacterium]
MNYSTETQKIGFFESVYESTAEQSLDADINLPDYCPEIRKILKCTVVPNINSVQNNSGRLTADATATVRIFYIGENGKPAGYEQNYPLQKFVESDKITSDSSVRVNIKTDYANCRAVNPRRIDVRAMMTFIFKVMNKREENILCSAEGEGIQTISDEQTVASLCGINERAFTLSEVIELPSDKPIVSQIINVTACAVTNEVKVINNKALLKGDCNIKLYYISDDSSAVEYIEHSVPISQIIELDGLHDNCKTGITLNVCSCETLPKADSSGDIRLIDFNARINAFIIAFDEKLVSFIDDSYSTLCETKNSFKSVELLSYNDNFETSFTNKVVLESIGVSVDCVLAVWCSDIKYNFMPKDGKCFAVGTYQANIVYKDNENQIGIIQKPVDFDCSVQMKEKAERTTCFGSVQIVSCSCAVTGDSRLELKTEMITSGIILSNYMKKYVNDIELFKENKRKDTPCALTIYFSDKGENIWNIARKYNTTVDAIKEENNFSGSIVEDKCMLLIPVNN